jgi:hypothetical protein
MNFTFSIKQELSPERNIDPLSQSHLYSIISGTGKQTSSPASHFSKFVHQKCDTHASSGIGKYIPAENR